MPCWFMVHVPAVAILPQVRRHLPKRTVEVEFGTRIGHDGAHFPGKTLEHSRWKEAVVLPVETRLRKSVPLK